MSFVSLAVQSEGVNARAPVKITYLQELISRLCTAESIFTILVTAKGACFSLSPVLTTCQYDTKELALVMLSFSRLSFLMPSEMCKLSIPFFYWCVAWPKHSAREPAITRPIMQERNGTGS